MRMAYRAWNCIEQKPIATCFRKAGFVIAGDETVQPDKKEETETTKVSVEEWCLTFNSLHLDPRTFQNFVEIDNYAKI